MPLTPMDEFLAHQTTDTFDRVFTSDRNFYDRYYFNLHSCSDEIFLITGMGQYPNLGTADAFVTVSIGDNQQHVVRASKELDGDRLSTTIGPLGVEIQEPLRRRRVGCEPNEWGLSMDLVFDGTVDAIEEPKTVIRHPHGRMQMETSRYSQVGAWSGSIEVDGQRFDVTPDRWQGVRDHSWGVRGVGEPEPPGIRVKHAAQGFGFFHGKPPTAFSPVAVTPDELGAAWDGGKVNLPLLSHLNGALFGRPDAGVDMTFDFPQLVAHAARTRPLGAGTIVGSGTVSNVDRSVGSSCLAEVRMLETIDRGQPSTPFMSFGDRIRIEMLDAEGRSIFGAIDQEVRRRDGAG